MSYLRRCYALYLEATESLRFDPADLLKGGAGLSADMGWRALTAHLAQPVQVTADDVAALGRFGPSVWVSLEEAHARVAPALVARLLDAGLLVRDDEGDVARADSIVRSAAWHPLAATMHRSSRWSDLDAEAPQRTTQADAIQRVVERHGAPPTECFEHGERIARFALTTHVDDDFDRLLQQRVTCRNYDPTRALSQALLGELLGRVFGVRGRETLAPGAVALKKNHPSGGSLHPLEPYLLLRRVEGLPVGLYHYACGAHALDLLRELTPEQAAALALTAVAGQQYFADAPAHVVLAARFARSQWKYRDHPKVLRVIQIEVGHAAQNLYLSATHQGLGAYITAAINEVEIEQALGLNPMLEGPLAVCGFGYRGATRETAEFDPLHTVWP